MRCAGRDMEKNLARITLVEGAYSYALTSAFSATARSLSPPYPYGIIGLASARVLYGSSWTATLLLESGLASAFSGGSWCWVAEATYRSDWLVGLSIPSGCSEIGGGSGCGVGLGTYSELRVRLANTRVPLWLSVSGGWIQGRHDVNGRRSLVEATWVLSPLSLDVELPLRSGPFDLRLAGGAGVYGGMHNAHTHPRPGHEDEVPAGIFELTPLDGGAGPGLDARVGLTMYDTVAVHGEAVFAPLVAGASAAHPPAWLSPLDAPRGDGLVTWRRLSAGLSVPGLWPSSRIGIEASLSELSPRAISHLGHAAVGVHFDVPLRAPP